MKHSFLGQNKRETVNHLPFLLYGSAMNFLLSKMLRAKTTVYTFLYKQLDFHISLKLPREDVNKSSEVAKNVPAFCNSKRSKLQTTPFQRLYEVYKKSQRRIDVEKTSCIYGVVRSTHGLLCFLQDTFYQCLFYPINLILAYPLNNKPQLLATF